MAVNSALSNFPYSVKSKLGRVIAMLTFVTLPMNAVADGLVKGRVVNEKSDIGLRGARVSIAELGLFVKTSLNGEFVFSVVPSGEYTISIDYIGAAKTSTKIKVKDEQTTTMTIEVPPFTRGIENVLVIGNSASFNQALNRQRNAESIKNIVNADAIGQYPDANTSEALQRLPGISVENDQGEGRWVRVRGLGPEFNSFTINGSRIPSPNATNRAVALDVIPSDLLESLEVTKTLTPDMDADSLGGSINVQSLSAFDRDRSFYKASAESHFDDHTQQYSPKFSLSGSKKLAIASEQENIGVAAALSWFSRDFGSDNVQTGGAWNGRNLARMEQRDYSINRERTGFSLNLDYKATKKTDLFLRSLYSKYADTQFRLANTIEFSRPIAQGYSSGARVTREVKDRSETSKIRSLVLGGKTHIKRWTLEYMLGVNKSSEDTPFHVGGAEFTANFDQGFSYTNTRTLWLDTPSAFFANQSYGSFEVEMAEVTTEDEENSIKLDIEREFTLDEAVSTFKFGVKISDREKFSDENVWQLADESFSLQDFVSGSIDYELGDMGSKIASAPIKQWVASQNLNEGRDEIGSALNDFTIDEDLNAAYFLGRINFNKLFVLLGARYEQTEFSASGNRIDVNEGKDAAVETTILSTTSFAKKYSDLFPAIHLRYKVDEKTQIRGAWTNSLVRPTFEQLSPAFNREDDEASFGNPKLDPLRSVNFDLGIEHYLGYASVISAFLFHKEINNFIYQIDLGRFARFDGVNQAVTFRNGEAASISGLEFAANKQFTELPAPWNGFFVGANLTFTESNSEIAYLEGDELLTRETPMPSQSDVTGNFTLGWENSTFSIRLAANYKSEYLLEINSPDKALEDVYVDRQISLDLLARWYINDNIQVFLQGMNLGDEPYYDYLGNRRLNNQYEEYGPSYRLGISLTNF